MASIGYWLSLWHSLTGTFYHATPNRERLEAIWCEESWTVRQLVTD